MRTICLFFVPFNSVKKITVKVNAFMLPDGEVDLNFQKGGICPIKNLILQLWLITFCY